MKILYTTLVSSEDYLAFAELMNHTLKNVLHTKYDFKAMTTYNVNVSDKYTFDYIKVPYKTSSVENKYFSTSNKYWLFSFYGYDYVVFLDADCFICDSIDEAVERLIEMYPEKELIGSFRAGDTEMTSSELFICKPNISNCIYCINKCDDCFDDENLLTDLYKIDPDMDKAVNDLLWKSIWHEGSYLKFLKQFPEAVDVLKTLDLEEFQDFIRKRISYRQEHLKFNQSWGNSWYDYFYQ